jgi:hypothetical protein
MKIKHRDFAFLLSGLFIGFMVALSLTTGRRETASTRSLAGVPFVITNSPDQAVWLQMHLPTRVINSLEPRVPFERAGAPAVDLIDLRYRPEVHWDETK